MSNTSPLVLQNVTKTFGKSRGIEDVSFNLKKGEVFGFLGPNGAGKSTTIRAILNFIKPTQGSITVFGLDSVEDSVEIKRRIGYLAGNFAGYSHLSGNQLLSFLNSLQQNSDKDYAQILVKRFDTELGRPLKQLSKGNQQKIGIVQAFMHQPELLILDEPTSGLDPLMQERFYQTVMEAKEAGSTILISSHNLGEVQRICDRAAFIRQGKLIDIQDIANTAKLAINQLTVTFGTTKVDAKAFAKISQVQEQQIEGKIGRFTVQGNMDALIKVLAAYPVENIQIDQASLEDVFLQMYTSEASV